MPAPLVLPISEYAPDLPDSPGNGSSLISNVYPRTSISYGSVAAPTPLYNALNARCQGGAAFRDINGNVHVLAGDAADLYALSNGGWTNVSRSPGSYSTAAEGQWQFVYFNDDIIGTNFNDPLQRFTLSSSSSFADIPNSPRGQYIAVVKNAFVVLGNTYDTTNGSMPQRLQWCAAGDAGSWPTPGTTLAAEFQAGAVNLFGAGGNVQGIAADLINADAVIFQEFAVKRMMYAGPPDIFSVLPVENGRGTPAPNSIIVSGGIAYYLGQDGFYAFDGGSSVPIGFDKIDKTVFADLDLGNIHRVVGAADPVNRLIWWAYPGANNSNGNPNRLLIYNWQLNRWSVVYTTCETIIKLLSIGYTLDELYTILGYSLDNLPAPLDSSLWTGGRLQLGLFDDTHTLNFMTGSPLAASVETQELQPTPGRRVLVRNARPVVDGVGSVPSVAIGSRDRQQQAVTYGAASAVNSLGMCPVRKSGRYIRALTTLPAADAAWQNISGVELDIVPQGAR